MENIYIGFAGVADEGRVRFWQMKTGKVPTGKCALLSPTMQLNMRAQRFENNHLNPKYVPLS